MIGWQRCLPLVWLEQQQHSLFWPLFCCHDYHKSDCQQQMSQLSFSAVEWSLEIERRCWKPTRNGFPNWPSTWHSERPSVSFSSLPWLVPSGFFCRSYSSTAQPATERRTQDVVNYYSSGDLNCLLTVFWTLTSINKIYTS